MESGVLIAFGTRAEVIKLAPIIHVLNRSEFANVPHHICSTGQQSAILDSALEVFKIRPHTDLHALDSSYDLNSLTATVLTRFSKLLRDIAPSLVLIHGDTSSALSAALASFYQQIPICHLEAGLRTLNLRQPFPEEANRNLISKIASFHLASQVADQHILMREGVDPQSIFVTGATIQDALALVLNGDSVLPQDDAASRYLLVTIHRRESLGDPLGRICEALCKIASTHQDIQIKFVLHPNPELVAEVRGYLKHCTCIQLLDPLPYPAFISLLAGAVAVLTDSAGVSEEAAILRIPLFIARDFTERHYLVDSGSAVLVGSNQEIIVNSLSRIARAPEMRHKIYGRETPLRMEKSEAIVRLIRDVILPCAHKQR